MLVCCRSAALAQTAAHTMTAVPRLVKYSGTFSLYEEQEGGVPLWTEIQNVQADANGKYRRCCARPGTTAYRRRSLPQGSAG